MSAGLGPQRTTLAWWRTAQTALGAAVLFAKFGSDRCALGWVAAAAAVVIAAVAGYTARRQSSVDQRTLLGIGLVMIPLAASVLVGLVLS